MKLILLTVCRVRLFVDIIRRGGPRRPEEVFQRLIVNRVKQPQRQYNKSKLDSLCLIQESGQNYSVVRHSISVVNVLYVRTNVATTSLRNMSIKVLI